MTHAETTCQTMGIVLSNRQKFACRILEARGFRFAAHFGTENCEQLAADTWVQALEHAGRYEQYVQEIQRLMGRLDGGTAA